MKAILVIDMPKNCEECNYCGFYQDDVDERACLLMESHFIGELTEGGRDVECPLKSMPMEFTVEKLSEEEQDSTKMLVETAIMKVYADGWNDCLKEINET